MLKTLIRSTAIASVLMAGAVTIGHSQDTAPMKSDSMSSDTMSTDGGAMKSDAMPADATGGGDAMKSDTMSPDTMKSDGDAMKSDAMPSDTMASDTMSSDMPMVGGAPMDPQKTIVENASQAKNLTTLVAAVKAAGLVDTLSGPGPFTVFAPTNAAFEKLPKGTVETLLKPENKDLLVKILTYHVVPAKATSTVAMQMIKDDGGVHDAKTVEGAPIALRMNGDKLVVIDQKGGGAVVEQADVLQSNGVVHVIDTVLMPK